MRPEITSLRCYGVAVRDGHLLLCRLGPNALDPGVWTLPGGGGDFGESPEETLVREFDEETGLVPTVVGRPLVFSRLWENPDSRINSVKFIYPVIADGDPRVELDGSTDLAAWVPLTTIPERRADLVDLALDMIASDETTPNNVLRLEWARRSRASQR